jgi:hypothetical protein
MKRGKDMNDFDIDKLLQQHFRAPPSDKLNRLEQDVWRRIRLEESKPTLASKVRDWFAPLWTPQFQFAPVALAVMIGLSAGTVSQGLIPHGQHISNSDMLSLNVFSAEYSQLPSSLMKVKL